MSDRRDVSVPERRTAVDHGNGFGHVSVLVVSQHAALHPLMEHVDLPVEAETKTTRGSDQYEGFLLKIKT